MMVWVAASASAVPRIDGSCILKVPTHMAKEQMWELMSINFILDSGKDNEKQ